MNNKNDKNKVKSVDENPSRTAVSGWKSRLRNLDWRHIAILFLIFLLAFGIRMYLFKYDLMFEFDTYWHTRMTEEVILHGAPPAVDPLAYYQLPGGSPIPITTSLFWYVGAFAYYIAAILFTGSLAFNKELLIQVVKFLPAFYGALTALLLYFLGKEIYDRRTGYIMAFFGAVSASFIYRTMAGFYEAGGLGHVFLLVGFVFLIRAVKNLENRIELLKNAALAGVFFGLLTVTYGIYQIVPVILVFFALAFGLELIAKKGFQFPVRFWVSIAVALAIFVTFLVFFGQGNFIRDLLFLILHSMTLDPANALSLLLPAGILVLLAIVGVFLFFSIRKESRSKNTNTEGVRAIVPFVKLIFLYLVLIGAIFFSLNKSAVTSVAASSVGEESPGYLYFAHKFNALIIFPVLMLLLMPLIEFKRKSIDYGGMLLFVFVLLSFYMAYDRLHYSYNFGVPIAIAAAYMIHYALKFFGSRDKTERQVVGVAFLFLTLAGVASATLFTQQNTPTIEENTGWKEGLYWLSKNTPVDSKVFNWWDEGHWITFIGERKAITDNRNYSQPTNADVGKFTTTDNLPEALALLQKYDSDYLVLGSDVLTKRNSMVLYGYYLEKPVPPEGDARFDDVQSFTAPCSEVTDSGGIFIACGNNKFPKATFETIPTVWTSAPTTVEDNRNPVFLYRSSDNSRLLKFSAKVNNSVFAKIWMYQPDVQLYFEEVFPNGGTGYSEKELKIFRVKKENLPQAN